ncbi:ATP-binding protein [Nitrosophilus kaiyonis]|uniref:sensor histidine kinase n=1 Tax=Nitrosophilus kaiyonis TaxID=2930200 RepID=UPI0024919525|nr:ATP-binding protein [Nitrosophilus kaiyonis]
MLKLNQIFLYHLFLLLILLFFLISGVSYYTLKNVEINHYKSRLKNTILLIEPLIANTKNLDDLTKKIKKLTNQRITIINRDGVVIGESDYDKTKMENHKNRPEIIEADKKGWGEKIRYSKTLKEYLLYVAKREGNIFIRAAISLKQINNNFLALWLKFLAIFAIFIFFALIISYFLSKKINNEITKLLDYLNAIANKNYSKSLSVNFAKEFEEIGDYLKKLTKKLKKREEKKDKINKKLKQINKQRSELISAISHEFKNPVAVINGYVQTLMEEEDLDKQMQKKFLEKIYNASSKISNMIDRLRVAIQFENNDLVPKKSRFDICIVAKEAVKLLRDKYKNREIIFECESTEVYADKTMIEMVLINLIDNALKYSESEVKVLIKNKEIKVIDKGIGIKDEEIEKITKKFYRARRNSWDNSMGLGLYLVNYILNLHNSKLVISSQYKKGSTFSFKL